MERFTKVSGGRCQALAAFVLALLCVAALADDKSTLLAAPYQQPYKWFASTDPNNQNEDYFLLKPGETRRIPLITGLLLRLWSTAFEPDKIELALQNGVRVELLKSGIALQGQYQEKAFSFYPMESTPVSARQLSDGAALVGKNLSKEPNKWFYQATVREKVLSAPASSLSAPNAENEIDWSKVDPEIAQTAQDGLKLFELPLNAKSPYQLTAAYGSARSQKGKPIPILNVTGQGAFVGLVLDIRPAPDTTRRTFAFLEGNEFLIADGKTYEGTGTEDFFNSAWYFPEKPFHDRYAGMSFKSKEPPRVTAYRWMVHDAVPFKKSFRFDLEHGNGSNSNDLEYRWVAFWYQKPGAKYEIADALANAPAPNTASENTAGESNSLVPIFAALAGVVVVGIYVALRHTRRNTRVPE